MLPWNRDDPEEINVKKGDTLWKQRDFFRGPIPNPFRTRSGDDQTKTGSFRSARSGKFRYREGQRTLLEPTVGHESAVISGALATANKA